MINAVLLNVYFILHYHLLFRKEFFFFFFFFFECLYFGEYNILICLYMFFGWEREYQLSTYATGEGRSIQNACSYYASCVRTHLHYSFSCFWQHFCLIVICLICRNLTLPLFKKKMFVRNGYFSPTSSISVLIPEARFFYIKLFLRTKFCQSAFNFDQIESTSLWKNSVQCTGNKFYFNKFNKLFNIDIYRVCLILLLLLLLLNVIAFAIS